ncbi:MAG TPA: hypothetical protein VD694_07680 [Nitrososphaeraceae archaeon]|nr:hypothetical protein [Nitrososphaeraceae archaeon]
MQIDLHIFDLMAGIMHRKRPRHVTIISILLSIFGISSLFLGVYSIFSFEYFSQISLYIAGGIHVLLAVGLLRGSKWARRITIIISILNLIYGIIFFGQLSIADSILMIIVYGFVLISLFKSKVKEYFRDFRNNDTPSLGSVPIFGSYKTQLISVTKPRTINQLGKFFLLFSIFSFIVFTILISSFVFQVSEDSKIDLDTRRTKNIDFNKTMEYYLYLFENLVVLGFGITWVVMCFCMQKNRSWSKTVILDLCVMYVAFGMVRLMSVENSIPIFIVYIAIQTAVALLLLFYFNRSDIEEYYQNMTYVK